MILYLIENPDTKDYLSSVKRGIDDRIKLRFTKNKSEARLFRIKDAAISVINSLLTPDYIVRTVRPWREERF